MVYACVFTYTNIYHIYHKNKTYSSKDKASMCLSHTGTCIMHGKITIVVELYMYVCIWTYRCNCTCRYMDLHVDVDVVQIHMYMHM